MPRTPQDEFDIDEFFVDARSDVEVSPEFLARVMADAESVQQGHGASVKSSPKTPFWSVLVAAVGGWQSVAGLATAAVVGIWIGINPPSALDDITVLAWADEAATYAEYLPAFDLSLIEEQL